MLQNVVRGTIARAIVVQPVGIQTGTLLGFNQMIDRGQKMLLALAICSVAILLPIWAVAQKTDPAKRKFDPVRLMEQLPPITEFELKSVAEADPEMNPEEFVIGVHINGKARAYPINMLTGPHREIINDELAGTAIAATW